MEEECQMPYITSFERYGIELGMQQARQECIAVVLEFRFGKAGKRLASRLREIRDIKALRTLLKFSLTADSWTISGMPCRSRSEIW
jgi:hypothetical protein